MNEYQEKLAKAKQKLKADTNTDTLTIKTGGTKKLAKSIGELEKSVKLVEQSILKTGESFDSEGIIKGLQGVLDGIAEVTQTSDEKLTQAISDVHEAIKQLKLSVNVESPEIPAPNVTVNNKQDLFERFKPVDDDTNSSNKYYGYVDQEGKWLIMRLQVNKSDKHWRWTSGDGSYKEAWRLRKSKEYVMYHEVEV